MIFRKSLDIIIDVTRTILIVCLAIIFVWILFFVTQFYLERQVPHRSKTLNNSPNNWKNAASMEERERVALGNSLPFCGTMVRAGEVI